MIIMSNNFAEINSNWQYVLPPSRPSYHELQRIQSALITADRDEPIAVLGSTIEFRNLLHSMGFKKIYIFEKNKLFYQWSNSWVAYSNDREYVVWGDWLETIKKYTDYFTAILSDLTMGNIAYTDRFDFYQAIYSAIKPKGFFIDKVLTHDIPHASLDSLMIRYERMPINLESVNRFSCEVLFCSTLLEQETIDTTKFYSVLKERYTTPVLSKYIEMAHLITPENCVWYYGRKWSDLILDYKKPYREVSIYDDVPNSPYYGRSKHFIHIK